MNTNFDIIFWLYRPTINSLWYKITYLISSRYKEDAPEKTFITEYIADSQTTSNASGASNEMDADKQQQDKDKNAGTLIIDATVADQKIAYPNDLGLLSDCREESERIIDILCKSLNVKEKPRTYRRKARKQYLLIARKKNKSKKELHKTIGQQLRYVNRNLKSIDALLDKPNYCIRNFSNAIIGLNTFLQNPI